MLQRNELYTWNKCNVCKSLPNLLSSSKSSQILQLRRSQSLSSCLKFVQRKFSYNKRTSISKVMNKETKKSNPTIGELLGDDDLFHNRYHHYYSSSRSKRKCHYYRSYSRSSIHVHYGRRKQRQSTYSHTTKVSQHSSPSKLIESIPDTHQVYPYSTAYSYMPLPAYCYYCYTNMTSYCPCLLSDYYGYQQEIYYETST
jgi:hypothetical protein